MNNYTNCKILHALAFYTYIESGERTKTANIRDYYLTWPINSTECRLQRENN